MKKSLWSAVVFWGALLGIIESTVGVLLHLLPVNIGWLIWTPIAFYCMLGAYRASGRADAAAYTALIAAVLKLTNLLLPMRIDMVINPAVSLVLEGAALSAAIVLTRALPDTGKRLAVIFSANTLWRAAYLGYMCLMPLWMREISPLASASALVSHLVTQNLLTSAAAFAVTLIPRAHFPAPRRLPPAFLAGMCAASAAMTLWL